MSLLRTWDTCEQGEKIDNYITEMPPGHEDLPYNDLGELTDNQLVLKKIKIDEIYNGFRLHWNTIYEII